jgi:tripartite-type tricarboxylate transporter receptor subunit TctC
MKHGIMKTHAPAAFALLLGALAPVIYAADGAAYPQRPIRLVAPIAPGGGVDTMARTLGPELAARLGQPVVIDNRPGAGGSIGAELVAKAAPDGHTLMLSGSAFVLHTLLYPARYDPLADFAPVTQLVAHPYVMLLGASVSAASVGELIALARKDPDAVSYASSGNGSLIHLSGELFKHLARVNMTHVPYKGIAASFPDLFAGRVQATFSSIPTALPHVKSARLRPIGVTSRERAPALPAVPTLEESGLAGFEVTQWYGVFAPAAVARPVVARLQREIAAVLKSPAMAQRFAAEGTRAIGSEPAQFSASIRRETEKWRALIAQANIRGN